MGHVSGFSVNLERYKTNLRWLRLGKEKKEERKKERKKKKPQDENIMVCPIP